MNPKVAIIVLNYRNWQDTIVCLESLNKVDYRDYLMIVVDNASHNSSIENIQLWAEGKMKIIEYEKDIAEMGGIDALENRFQGYTNDKKLILIKNNINLGYSAGNNVGIKYALGIGAKAILILNPDIRITEKSVLSILTKVLFSSERTFIVAPRIIGLQHEEQSPLRQPGFWEEIWRIVLSPVVKFDFIMKINDYTKPFTVERIPGCFMLIKADFLKKTNLLDENVFLYGEEAILSTKVQREMGEIVFVPYMQVYHCHKKPAKKLYEHMIKSRKYYLTEYKSYNRFQIAILLFLYKLLYLGLKVLKK